MNGLRIGQEVKLTDYSKYGDYRRHRNQKATIIRATRTNARIMWKDGTHSVISDLSLLLDATQTRSFTDFLNK